MKRLTAFEQFEYYVHALENVGLFLRDCDTSEIEYRVFEEFDTDCISFLHVNTLNSLLRAGLITKEIFDLSLELAQKFRSMEGTSYWNPLSVQSEEAWIEILALADTIKATLKGREQVMTKEAFLQYIQSTCVYPKRYTPPFLHWYPLTKITEGIPAVAYDLDRIYDDRRIRKLKSVLKAMFIGEVTSIQNQNCKSKPEQVDLLARLTEKDEDGYNFPWYVESYYYDESKAWLIYVSHEGTITFAGEKLAKTAMEILPGKYHRSNTGIHEN